jgi:hypothetical protein
MLIPSNSLVLMTFAFSFYSGMETRHLEEHAGPYQHAVY